MVTAPKIVEINSILDNAKLSKLAVRVVVLSLLVTILEGFDMMAVSYTAPYLKDGLGLSKTMLGNIFSAGVFGMMLGGLVLSALGDRFGRRRVIVIAAFAVSLLMLGTATSVGYWSLLVLRALTGFAIGGMLPLIWALNIEFVGRRLRATVVTLVMVGYSLGVSLAAPVTNAFAPRYGWPSIYLIGGAATLIFSIILLVGLPESVCFLAVKGKKPELLARTVNRLLGRELAGPQDQFVVAREAASVDGLGLRPLLRQPYLQLTGYLWLGFLASSFGMYFVANWGPTILEDMAVPRAHAANIIAIGTFAGSGAGLLLTWLTDRIGPLAIGLYPLLAIPTLVWTGLAAQHGQVATVLFIVVPALVTGGHFAITSVLGVYYPTIIRANAAGWAASVGKVGGVAGPIVGGLLLSAGQSAGQVWLIVALCPAIVVVCAIGIALVVKARLGEAPLAAVTVLGP